MTDDPESPLAPILASDAERERSIALLRDAVGEGRLTLEEFSERVGLAQAARTRPGSGPPRSRPARRPSRGRPAGPRG